MSGFDFNLDDARVIGKCIHCEVGVYILPMIELVIGSHFRVVDTLVHVKGHERCQGPNGFLSTCAEVRKLRSVDERKETA